MAQLPTHTIERKRHVKRNAYDNTLLLEIVFFERLSVAVVCATKSFRFNRWRFFFWAKKTLFRHFQFSTVAKWAIHFSSANWMPLNANAKIIFAQFLFQNLMKLSLLSRDHWCVFVVVFVIQKLFPSIILIRSLCYRRKSYISLCKKIEIVLPKLFWWIFAGLCRTIQSFPYRNRHWQPAIDVRVVKCLQKLLFENGSFVQCAWVCVCVRWRAAYTTTEWKIVFENFLYSIDGVIAMP